MAQLIDRVVTVIATIEFREEELVYLRDLLQNRLVEKESAADEAARKSIYYACQRATIKE